MLQLVRLPVLLGLLFATGAWLVRAAEAVARLRVAEYRGWWLRLVLVMIAFTAVALIGRRREHVPGVLAAEGLVAAVLGFVPPLQWVLWFGIGGWFVEAVGSSVGPVGLVQPLSIAWLGIVVSTFVGQRRRRANESVAMAGDAR